jgi:YHS domain-containing protein
MQPQTTKNGLKIIVVSIFCLQVVVHLYPLIINKKVMKNLIGLTLAITCMLLVACSNPTSEATTNDTSANMVNDTITNDMMSTKTYDVSLVNNKKDPTCGMPVTAGISDTAHYEKYVLGFCSKECKDEFLKNPKAAIAAAEVK